MDLVLCQHYGWSWDELERTPPLVRLCAWDVRNTMIRRENRPPDK